MELTNIQKHLITGLMIFGVEEDAIVGIVSVLKEEKQQCLLMEWMSENRKAAPEDIFMEVSKIHNIGSETLW